MAAESVVASVAVAAVAAWALRLRHSGREKPQEQPRESHSIEDAGGYIGLDIGGSLAKLVYFEPDESTHSAQE